MKDWVKRILARRALELCAKGILARRVLELLDDKGRLIDEINDCKAKADKAYCEKANAEIKLDEAKELIKNIIRVTWGEGWNYSLGWKVKAEAFIRETQQ